MPINLTGQTVYGFPQANQTLPPAPIIANRAPTTRDFPSGLGQAWVYVGVGVYFCDSTAGNSASWALAGTSSDVNTLTGDTGGAVVPSSNNINVVGGTGIATSGSGATLTINAVGGGTEYNEVTANTQMVVNTGYITNKAGSACTVTLPATAAVGDFVSVVGKGATGWVIAQNAGQTISMNSVSTTAGVGGSLASTETYNSTDLICITANSGWEVVGPNGIFTVV